LAHAITLSLSAVSSARGTPLCALFMCACCPRGL
jgi:hypothetical protein